MSDHETLTVTVAEDLKRPLETLASSLRQPPASIVNRALKEFLERDRPAAAGGRASSYIELTLRENTPGVF